MSAPERQTGHARRGELERQRQAAQLSAQPSQQRGVGNAELEVVARGAGALQEQLDRLGLRARLQIVAGWQAEGWNTINDLAFDPERLTAGGQHAQPCTGKQQHIDKLGASFDQVLAVVEHEQVACAQRVRQPSLQRPGESSATPRAAAIARGTSEGSPTGASSTTTISRSLSTSRQTRVARRVLPAPPGPASVTSDASVSSSTIRVSSCWRPTKLLSSCPSAPVGDTNAR